MMDDLISRQQAIDAVNNLTYPSSIVDVKRILVDLPSAQQDWDEMIVICDCCGHAIHVKRFNQQEGNNHDVK